MKVATKFWEHVGDALEQETRLGHPTKWKRSVIENFLFVTMLGELQKCFTRNPNIKRTLNIKNALNINGLIPSYDTFRRIFQTKESNGLTSTKNLFAFYLENLTYQEYLKKYDIKAPPSKESEPNVEEVKAKEKSANSSQKSSSTTNQILILGDVEHFISEMKDSNFTIHNGDIIHQHIKKEDEQ